MIATFPEIVVRGGYGLGNFGDDALMVACEMILSEAIIEENILFECEQSDYLLKILKVSNIVSKKETTNAPILIYGGGTQFYSFPLTSGKSLVSLLTKAYGCLKDPQRLVNYLTKKIRIKKDLGHTLNLQYLAAIGIGLGPFVAGSSQEKNCEEIFRKMDFVSVRDAFSYKLCREWDIKNLNYGSDLCYCKSFLQYIPNPKEVPKNKVGIIIRDWKHTKDGASYMSKITSLVKELKKLKINVDIISFSNKSDQRLLKLLENCSCRTVVWQRDIFEITDFINILNTYDFFLTARYHGAIFASILSKPFIAIDIEPKLNLVHNVFQHGSHLWKFPFNIDDCIFYINTIFAKYESYVQEIEAEVAMQRNLTMNMIDEFKKSLLLKI